jgi:peroxiredoxin
MVSATAKMANAQAPDFTLPGEDGKTYALKDLASKRPVLLFFIVDSCPCCVTARPYIDRIQNTYKDVLTVVGVINANASIAGQWARNNSAKFPLLLDPKLQTIHAYKAKRGTYMALIAPGGTIEKVFPGYSQRLVTDLGARVVRMAGVAPRTIEVADLPKTDTTGCEFDMVGKS